MSATQSNLSNPKFGYDLVVAVTQASINSTMKAYLNSVTSPEVIVCYAYESATSDNIIPIDYEKLKTDAKGSDPFSIPDGSDANTDQDLINLANANFAGGFKARIGLPQILPSQLPPIVTLGQGTDAPVVFNLLCSEFQVVGFQYMRSGATWINQAELTGNSASTPWYFTANVNLNNSKIDPDSTVPPDVQKQINKLTNEVGPNAFSIQNLFLDLDTAILLATPTVEGIPEGWAVWNLVQSEFMGQYFAQLQQTGNPVLSYSATVNNPKSSTIQLGAMSMECCQLLDSSGNEIKNPSTAQKEAATLNYLCTTGTTAPVATVFPWNWLELSDVTNYSGIQAVRRDVFANYLAKILNSSVKQLCIVPKVFLTQGKKLEDPYEISYSSSVSSSPKKFSIISSNNETDPDGFIKILELAKFYSESSDKCTANDDMSSINGSYSYTLTGYAAVKGNQVLLKLHPVANMAFGHNEVGVKYHDLPAANYIDKTYTVIFDLNINSNGSITVNNPVPTTNDNSAPWNFHAKGILGATGCEKDVKNGLDDTNKTLAETIDAGFSSYANNIKQLINHSKSWVFPGGSSFSFAKLSFSENLDLITHITYAAV